MAEAPAPVLPADTLATGGALSISPGDHKAPRVEPPEPVPPPSSEAGAVDTTEAYQIGYASHYGKAWKGRRTASGERYSPQKLTAAHRVLPLGTRIRVTNLRNGRHVEVWVNDRGPFVRGRIVDLSYAAAEQLEMLGTGTARVMIELAESLR
jgi:rare lipoprotein A